MSERLKETLSHLPHKPGVYQYFNAEGHLLYVGKAKDLFKRVNSYWQNKTRSPWTDQLVKEIDTVTVTEVKSEYEAILLENSFIKSLHPKYNIQLKDDKTFPFLRVSNDDLPRFTIVRQAKKDKARYFGPFFSATFLRTMLSLLQELYGIKVASDSSYEARSSVPKEIGLGARNLDNAALYNQNVALALKFIATPQKQMEKIIKQRMAETAGNQEFERAAILRDKLFALQQLRTTQSLFSPNGEDCDYVGICQVGKLVSVYILFEHEGKITHHKEYMFEYHHALTPEALAGHVVEYLYIQGLALPKKIVVANAPPDQSDLEKVLSDQAGRTVLIHRAIKGDLRERLNTAEENAAYQMKLEGLKKGRREQALTDLAQRLSLPKIPRRIEACDISNLGPTNIVGATIVFIDGQPAKKEYRKYKINTPKGQDDFASMRELVFRRLKQADRPLDLLLIDGGKGQLSAAQDAMKLAQVEVPMISLAKKEELIFLPSQSDPLVLPHDSDALLLLTAIRDEVHRFVIGFHRFRRGKKLIPNQS